MTLKLLKPLTLAAFSALSTYQIIQKMKSFLRSDITLLKRFNEMKTQFLDKKTSRLFLSTFWNIFSLWTHLYIGWWNHISSWKTLKSTSRFKWPHMYMKRPLWNRGKRQRIIRQKIIIIQNVDASVVLSAAPFSEIESHNCLLNNKVAGAPNQNANFKTRQYFSDRSISQKFLRNS